MLVNVILDFEYQLNFFNLYCRTGWAEAMLQIRPQYAKLICPTA